MHVAITGASGFIGRHVINQLLTLGCKLTLLTRDAKRIEDIAQGLEVIELDLTGAGENPWDLLGRPDILLHLAWNGLSDYQSRDHYEIELPNHYRFLKACVDAGLSRLVCAGTCLEYGMYSGALAESFSTEPVTAYGYAKDALRRQLQFLQKEKKFELAWLRFFYLYGTGQSPSSLFCQVRQAAANGESEFSMSGGEQLRDYLPVDEASRLAAELALATGETGVINICSGRPVSVRRLVEEWVEQNGWALKLVLGKYPYFDYEPFAFWGDRRRLNTILERKK